MCLHYWMRSKNLFWIRNLQGFKELKFKFKFKSIYSIKKLEKCSLRSWAANLIFGPHRLSFRAARADSALLVRASRVPTPVPPASDAPHCTSSSSFPSLSRVPTLFPLPYKVTARACRGSLLSRNKAPTAPHLRAHPACTASPLSRLAVSASRPRWVLDD